MKRIGVAAVEDEGIYVGVAIGDGEGLRRCEYRPPLYRRPPSYDSEFIANTVQGGIEKIDGRLDAIGISMFGQIEGTSVTAVPRPDWPETVQPLNFASLFSGNRWKGVPVKVGHDSATAALAEYHGFRSRMRGALGDFVRIRIGTGVGVGTLAQVGKGKMRRAIMREGDQQEGGHCMVPPFGGDENFASTCGRHPDGCMEGVVSEAALCMRVGVDSLSEIEADNPVWDIVADCLGHFCVEITNLLRPELIVISGRTMFDASAKPPQNGQLHTKGRFRTELLDKARATFREKNGGYPNYRSLHKRDYISEPALYQPGYAGFLGAAELARRDLIPVLRVVSGNGQSS